MAADSIKYEPLLATGTDLAVIGGPVAASGYTWYEVWPVAPDTLRGGHPSGWIAAGDKDGTPWIKVRSPAPEAVLAPSGTIPISGPGLALNSRIRAWPGPEGGAYIVIEDEERAVIAGYDRRGALREGWPVAISSEFGCDLWPVRDGSVRVACADYAFAFNAAGLALAGWPVAVGNFWDARAVGEYLHVSTESGLAVIAPDGRITMTSSSAPTALPDTAPAGAECSVSGITTSQSTQFVVTRCRDNQLNQTVDYFDAAGRRASRGWPVKVPSPGALSDPVTSAGGRVYEILAKADGRGSTVLAFESNGLPVKGWPVDLPGQPVHVGSWADPFTPMPPVVAADGTIWFITEQTAYAIGPDGRVRSGSPYRSNVPLGSVGYSGCDTDGTPTPSTPLLGPDGVLYLIQAPTKTTGGRITSLGVDGAVRSGWPVVLPGTGAEFWSTTAAPDGSLLALAVDMGPAAEPPQEQPCPPPAASAFILAINADGSVRYRITVVDP